MRNRKILIQRISGVVLILLGLILAVTWDKAKFCIGDQIFTAIGLPAWSKGTGGLHYPAVIGSLTALFGIGILNLTLQKKAQKWVWGSVLLFLIAVSFLASRL